MTENEALKLMESLQISKDCELIKTLDFKATVIKALEDLQQYRAIGNIEEFKDLKEKATPKKPIRKPNADMTHEEVTCPTCGSYCSAFKNKYCDCGQKLDWEGGE